MKLHGAIGAAAAAAVMAGGCLLYGYLQPAANANPEYVRWNPSAEAIRSKIGSAAAPAPGMTESQRRDEFCKMFKDRFRYHSPAVAVGMRFMSPTRIKLMCPARMEPYYIDEIALAAWHEAREDFGGSIDIDIFDTYIGTNRIKIGELRTDAASRVAHISYDYTEVDNLNHPERRVPRADGTLGPVPVRLAPRRAAQPPYQTGYQTL